ncbi:SOS response-associated peptidase [Clostridium sp. MCC353]|uniref:SOS response-associated peptidase n=1 Tax=Clostridium sp. MCC353 TaxID=2592646 RepID=UPI001C013A47|nr:SOS response-associated peptidase [Clostridium sp. MCC353]MBT9779421.1 SOS response-associated peptidase [Clostridium sp. MCC353]
MCGRYYIDDETAREIKKLVRQIDDRLQREKMGRDIHPTDLAPVLKGNGTDFEMEWQKWGLPGIQNKGVIFNARSETVLEKRMFKEGVRRRRIIVPCTWFYEWNKNKEKITFYRNDSPVLFLAGFYNRTDDGDRFVIITTEANESMKEVHDRMPLILEPDELEDWVLEDEKTEEILRQKPTLLEKRAEYEQQTLQFF